MAWVIIATGEVPENYGTQEATDEFSEAVHKDEHDIYDDGYDACELGESKEANPWKSDTYASSVWSDGWDDFDMNGA